MIWKSHTGRRKTKTREGKILIQKRTTLGIECITCSGDVFFKYFYASIVKIFLEKKP